MGATIFVTDGWHGACRYQRHNSPPLRETSRRAIQTSPRATRSRRELLRGPVNAVEAVGGREERPSCHGVRSSAGAALINPFWGIRKLARKAMSDRGALVGLSSTMDGEVNPTSAPRSDWPKCTDDLSKSKQPFCGMKNISAAIQAILKIKRCPRKPDSWSARYTHEIWVHSTPLVCYSIPNFEHKNISLLVES